jgi:hypothetical protein
LKVLGHIPTAWYPSQVAVSGDGRTLYVASAKGYGSGPNGGPGFKLGPEGTAVAALQKGVVSIIDIPPDRQLGRETWQVIRNNGFDLRRQPARSIDASVRVRPITEHREPADQVRRLHHQGESNLRSALWNDRERQHWSSPGR